jgi:AcrR family transcriptional regulator
MMTNEDKEFYSQVYELYGKYGIRSVTMDDIARELGMSKKTLYEKVANKEELVEKVVDLGLKERAKCFRDVIESEGNAIDQLFKINELVTNMIESHNPALEYDMKKYYPSVYKNITEVKYENMYNIILKNIESGKKSGLYRADVNAELITKLYVSRISSLMSENHFTKSESLAPDFMVEINIYHIRGLATEKGISELEKKLKSLEHKK